MFSAILLSLTAAALATVFNLPVALFLALGISRTRSRLRSLVEGVSSLALVLPPVTIGYLLLLLFGRQGLIGALLYQRLGFAPAFSFAAVIMAATIVSFPLVLRSILLSLDHLDSRLLQAAAALGQNGFRRFVRITLPLCLPGILHGAVLGFARSLSEFGATITFAGNIAGSTRTIPLAIYSLLQNPGQEYQAAILAGVSVLLSLVIMIGASFLDPGSKRRANATGI